MHLPSGRTDDLQGFKSACLCLLFESCKNDYDLIASSLSSVLQSMNNIWGYKTGNQKRRATSSHDSILRKVAWHCCHGINGDLVVRKILSSVSWLGFEPEHQVGLGRLSPAVTRRGHCPRLPGKRYKGGLSQAFLTLPPRTLLTLSPPA